MQETQTAKVSVIIPTYNRAGLILRTIDSVLAQTYKNIEIIVVDDGSTDNTEEIVASQGSDVKYLRQPKLGACAARNLGVLHATGDYFVFLDSDDTIMPTMVEQLARALDQNPRYGAAYCGWRVIDEAKGTTSTSPLDKPSGDVFAAMCTTELCIIHSVMVRRDCLSRSGLFDTRLKHRQDIDFWTRVAAHCEFIFVPEHLAQYHRGSNMVSLGRPDLAEAGPMVLSKLSPFLRSGRLSKQDWRLLARRLNINYANNCTSIAFAAYDSGEWAVARYYALRSLYHKPRNLLSRKVMLMFVRSCALSMLPRRKRPAD